MPEVPAPRPSKPAIGVPMPEILAVLAVLGIAVLGIAAAPLAVGGVIGLLSPAAGVELVAPAIVPAVRILVTAAAALAIISLVRGHGKSAARYERDLPPGREVEIYRGFTRDVGIQPPMVRKIVDITAAMTEDEREGDFRRASQPSFAAELGYHLGIDAETRALLREFFAEAGTERRSFSSSTRMTIENGRIERSQETTAEAGPAKQPQDGEAKEDSATEGHPARRIARVFDPWDPAALPDTGPDPQFVPPVADFDNSDGDAAPDPAALPHTGPDPQFVPPVAGEEDSAPNPPATGCDDPDTAALVAAAELAARLPRAGDLLALYAYRDPGEEVLLAEFATPKIRHVDELDGSIEPAFFQAGVRRHRATAWRLDLSRAPDPDEGLGSPVWIPVGLCEIDPNRSEAWKLVQVPPGESATFYCQDGSMSRLANRLASLLGSLYPDLAISEDPAGVRYSIPSNGTTITLAGSDDANPASIHGDADRIAGPHQDEIHAVTLLGDLGQRWFAQRLGVDAVAHGDWLALLSLMTTLLMRSEPVDAKDLLGAWATPGSDRGRDLLDLLARVFGDALDHGSGGWELSNVRLDVFWLEELLELDPGHDNEQALASFFTTTFQPQSLEWLFHLSAMDPRSRTTDAIRLENLAKDVLAASVARLAPSATGTLADHLGFIASTLEQEG